MNLHLPVITSRRGIVHAFDEASGTFACDRVTPGSKRVAVSEVQARVHKLPRCQECWPHEVVWPVMGGAA